VIARPEADEDDSMPIHPLCRVWDSVQLACPYLKLAKKGETAEKRAVSRVVGYETNAVGLKCL
jgi:hypothetical protein